jgi:hypothetical protein
MLLKLISRLIQEDGLSPWIFVAYLTVWSLWLSYALHRPLNKKIIAVTTLLPILAGTPLSLQMNSFDPLVMFTSLGYLSALSGIIIRKRLIAENNPVSLEVGLGSTILGLLMTLLMSGV